MICLRQRIRGSEVPAFELARASGLFHSGATGEINTDGARDGGELLGVAVIVVGVGIEGATWSTTLSTLGTTTWPPSAAIKSARILSAAITCTILLPAGARG